MYDPSVSPPTLHFYKSKLIIKVNLKFQPQSLPAVPRFKTALQYRDRFTFGHEKLHRTLMLDLHADHIIAIFGESRYSNALVTRLVVR